MDSSSNQKAKISERIEELIGLYGSPRAEGIRELARLTGFKPNTIDNWAAGRSLPKDANTYIRLANVTNQSLDWLIRGIGTINQGVKGLWSEPVTALLGSEVYEQMRDRLIRETRNSLWVQSRTGRMFDESDAKLSNILLDALNRNKIRLRVMLSDPAIPLSTNPNSPMSYADSPTLTMVARRRPLTFNNNELAARTIENTIQVFLAIANQAGILNRLEIRVVPYAPSYILFISDGEIESSSSNALALLFNFRGTAVADAPMMLANKVRHKPMFEFFYRDYLRLWQIGKDVQTI